MSLSKGSLTSGGGRQQHKPDWQEQYNLLMIRKHQADHQLETLEAILSEDEDGIIRLKSVPEELGPDAEFLSPPAPEPYIAPLADESLEVVSRKALLARHRQNFFKADLCFVLAAILVGGLAVYTANLPVFDPASMDSQGGALQELTQLMKELVAMGHAGINVYEPLEYTGTGN